tara:strand:+ start:2898 stop:3533 length:636 start_codon:yes stop_codon:yes gene_type:complete
MPASQAIRKLGQKFSPFELLKKIAESNIPGKEGIPKRIEKLLDTYPDAPYVYNESLVEDMTRYPGTDFIAGRDFPFVELADADEALFYQSNVDRLLKDIKENGLRHLPYMGIEPRNRGLAPIVTEHDGRHRWEALNDLGVEQRHLDLGYTRDIPDSEDTFMDSLSMRDRETWIKSQIRTDRRFRLFSERDKPHAVEIKKYKYGGLISLQQL